MGSTPTHRVRAPRRRDRSPTAFHLLQNLRPAIERQLSGLERPIRGYRANPGRLLGTDGEQPGGGVGAQGEPRELTHVSGRPFLLAAFAKVRAMYDAGATVAAITRKLRLTRKIVDKWVRLECLPERARRRPSQARRRSLPPTYGIAGRRDRGMCGACCRRCANRASPATLLQGSGGWRPG